MHFKLSGDEKFSSGMNKTRNIFLLGSEKSITITNKKLLSPNKSSPK